MHNPIPYGQHTPSPNRIINYVGQKFNDDIVKISAEICGQDP